ncbi:MAG: hypothetical protein ACRDSJ_17450 [Rubrobacteraceae bacterium]
MTTHQTKADPGRSIEKGRGGLLRVALKLDAAATGAVGALMLLAAGTVVGVQRPFVALLGIPASVLVAVGVFLIVYAVFVWGVGSRRRVSRTGAWIAVAINVAYVAGCVAVVAAGWFPLTALGVLFVLAQAAAVAIFAVAQYLGLRRNPRTTEDHT